MLWRRVAGGLNSKRQISLAKKYSSKLTAGAKVSPEIIRLLGSLERILPEQKLRIVKKLVTALTVPPEKNNEPCAWALGRILSRTPLYAGPECILPPEEVEKVFEKLKDLDWSQKPFASLNTLFAMAARRTDKRDIDVTPEARKTIAAKMERSAARQDDVRMVREIVPVKYADQVRQFGESLPAGLFLIQE